MKIESACYLRENFFHKMFLIQLPHNTREPSYQYFSTITQQVQVIISIIKRGMKLFIHSQTSICNR